MNKLLKYGLLFFTIIIISIFGLIGFGFYSMEIEDHYGDLKELYYGAKNGDIILNRTISEFGIIEKNWRRINIRTKRKDSMDLYNWVYPRGIETKVEIYRPIIKSEDFYNLEYSEIVDRIKASEMTFVIGNQFK